MQVCTVKPSNRPGIAELQSKSCMKILTLSCAFPNPAEPLLGTFIRSRMQGVAKFADVKVVAPLGVLNYSHIGKKQASLPTPHQRYDGRLDVVHPRYFYPPGGTVLNPLFLAAQLIAPLMRLHRQFPYQVIDSHFGYPSGVAAALVAAFLKIPFVVTLRGNETMHAQDPMISRSLKWALRRAPAVITVSQRLREFAIAMGAAPSRVRTIPNGIEVSVFYLRDRVESRLKHGIALDEKLILSAGALIERKGHHRIVRALKSLEDNGLRARLLIAGGPGPEGGFERQTREVVAQCGLNSRVDFLGAVKPESLAELMSASDVLCLASSREGWPNVVHESLGCGTPVVSTDIGGIPDMLPSEQYGLIVPLGDQPALEQGLSRALRKTWDRDAISAWGRSRSWDCVAKEVLEVFDGVIQDNRL
jgi:glycosyltransferase involved in cell wall biosynthesis